MKPPPFEYHRPASVDEAIELLARHEGARVLAGGQSLMPMLNFRVTAPAHLVDINRIGALSYIRDQGEVMALGALTRQRAIEFSPVVAARLPLLAEAILQVGHRQTRNRGTLGGSLCHLDPSAELPTVAMAMDGVLTVRGARGERSLTMAEFAAGYMTNALAPDEILCELRLRPWAPGHGTAFIEFARRKGDFAIVAAAVLVALDPAGRIARIAIALGGAAPTPMRMPAVEAALAGKVPTPQTIEQAAALCSAIDALADPAVPAWYRQHLAVVLAQRAIGVAVQRAQQARGANR